MAYMQDDLFLQKFIGVPQTPVGAFVELDVRSRIYLVEKYAHGDIASSPNSNF